ncbi:MULTISPECIES: IclR family transcriptional regulator [Chelativorans]|jgi:IclR family pca regulon transcriptional regulator|uniref:Transcriptional regulator, IclR family n=1 Tax=Chelativorans sp. (strain BNC1) TaxID=266779 RepID=Q11D51_CHESB|nr:MULTISPECIES: IclR family transcriptional regulator [Chelativorans]
MATPLNGTILKAFQILRLASFERPDISAQRVQSELGMNFATAHRFLVTLEEAGALISIRRGVYRLGPSVGKMGRLAESTTPHLEAIQPFLDALRARLNESVMLCRFSRAGPTCVAVALAERPITVAIRIGTTLNFLTSAQGRLWLASLEPWERDELLAGESHLVDRPGLEADLAAIRRDGVAQNYGDAEPDIAAVAAPIRNAQGDLLLTVAVFGPKTRFTSDFISMAAESVKRVAGDVEISLTR